MLKMNVGNLENIKDDETRRKVLISVLNSVKLGGTDIDAARMMIEQLYQRNDAQGAPRKNWHLDK